MTEEKKLICVLCGHEWINPISNVCENEECDGLCTWGYEMGKPSSFTVDENDQWHLNPAPKEAFEQAGQIEPITTIHIYSEKYGDIEIEVEDDGTIVGGKITKE